MADQSPKQRRRRRPLESYNKTWLGVGAIAVVAVLIGSLLTVKVANVGYTHYTARFLQAAALQPGNPITVAGIPVGEVTSMKLAGDHVEAGLEVRNDVALGEDSRATIKITTILGSRYLALYPKGPGSLPDNTFEVTHTEVPYDLQEALADVTTTYEQVDSDKFAQTLSILGHQLEGMPAILPQALENTHTLSTIIADRRDQLGSLLKTTELVSNTLHRQQSSIGSLINQGNDLIGEFVTRRESFRAMMASLTNLIETLGSIVIDDRPELEKLAEEPSRAVRHARHSTTICCATPCRPARWPCEVSPTSPAPVTRWTSVRATDCWSTPGCVRSAGGPSSSE